MSLNSALCWRPGQGLSLVVINGRFDGINWGSPELSLRLGSSYDLRWSGGVVAFGAAHGYGAPPGFKVADRSLRDGLRQDPEDRPRFLGGSTGRGHLPCWCVAPG